MIASARDRRLRRAAADRLYAVRTLRAFGMDGLYGEDPLPLVLAGSGELGRHVPVAR